MDNETKDSLFFLDIPAKARLFQFLLLLFGLSGLTAFAEDSKYSKNIGQIEDSLYRELENMPRDSTYLKKIGSLELLLMDSPKFLFYAELKEKEARRQNRMDFVCESMSDRALYYSYKEDIDSFYYWKNKMDPIALEIKEFNYYFFLCNEEVSQLIRSGKIEKAIQTAKKMYKTAKHYSSKDGLIASGMSIGEAMYSSKRYNEAIEAYEDALSTIPFNEKRWKSWKLSIYDKLINLCLKTEKYQKALDYANKEDELMEAIQESRVGKNKQTPYLVNEYVTLQLQKAKIHLKLNNTKKALKTLEEAKIYYNDIKIENQNFFHLAMADYYESEKEWNKALEELNIAFPYFEQIKAPNMPQLSEQKARLLGNTGFKDAAIIQYQDLIILKDSVNNKWFDSQLSELRTIYDTDHLTLQNKELELKNKHTQLQIILVSFALTVLILIIISALYIRISRMKKKLEYSEYLLINEKEELVKSQSELKMAKDKAEETRDMALKAERKESFFANMSHEVRTPLNAIVGFSSLLTSGEELSREEQALFIGTIHQNCDQLLKLVNDILDLSRMESGKLSFSISQYNLTDLMNEIHTTHQLMIPEHVTFLKTYPEVPVVTYTDKTRLKQVITNFINNAKKFTTSGHIRIGYEVNYLDQTITLFVEDTGKGIPEEHQKKIFERFYKQDDFDQGTGLGLSICTVIAEKLGGHLTLKSEIGIGSCFAIILPYNKEWAGKQFF